MSVLALCGTQGQTLSRMTELIFSLFYHFVVFVGLIGTMAEALIQFSYPNFSVFNFSISPDLQGILNETNPSPSIPSSISTIGTTTLQNRPLCFATHCGNASTSQRYYGLLTDGAAGDPASLGISVLLAGLDEANQGKNVSGTSYGKAVSDEVQYLLQVVPRVSWGN